MEHRWGMSIDLDRCTGCEACVVACHAENNLPISSPDQAEKGRTAHWIRVDRYYEGEFPDVKVKYRPVLCQQCDNAPCEPVCPTYATYHNAEGLNVQVYNRCVGTFYCANNCPYTVRFFNWLRRSGLSRCSCSTIRMWRFVQPASWRSVPSAYSASSAENGMRRTKTARWRMAKFSLPVCSPAQRKRWCLAI